MDKKTTKIEDLARMVQQEFAESKSHIDEQFTQVDKRFGQIDQRFTEIDERFTHVDEQFVQVNQELRAIRKELGGIVYRPEFEALQDQVRDLQHLVMLLKKKAA